MCAASCVPTLSSSCLVLHVCHPCLIPRLFGTFTHYRVFLCVLFLSTRTGRGAGVGEQDAVPPGLGRFGTEPKLVCVVRARTALHVARAGNARLMLFAAAYTSLGARFPAIARVKRGRHPSSLALRFEDVPLTRAQPLTLSLSHPHAQLSTSAAQEDHVSMGGFAARKVRSQSNLELRTSPPPSLSMASSDRRLSWCDL